MRALPPESPQPEFAVRNLIAHITLGVYYLTLGTWFGGTIMMGLSAGLTFATVRRQPLVLTDGPGSRPELAERAQEFLAGNVVLESFAAFTVLQSVCAALLIVVVLLQHTLLRERLVRRGATAVNAVRVGLIVVALGLFVADLALTRPFMAMLREEMYYHDGISADAMVNLDAEFDRLHQRSSRSMGAAAMLMALACVASPAAFVAGTSPRRPA